MWIAALCIFVPTGHQSLRRTYLRSSLISLTSSSFSVYFSCSKVLWPKMRLLLCWESEALLILHLQGNMTYVFSTKTRTILKSFPFNELFEVRICKILSIFELKMVPNWLSQLLSIYKRNFWTFRWVPMSTEFPVMWLELITCLKTTKSIWLTACFSSLDPGTQVNFLTK